MRLHTSNQEPTDALDRLWAATRPEEPSAEQFGRMWAGVVARASEPEVVPFSSARSWGLKSAIFAQAAVLLIAAVLALKGTPQNARRAAMDPKTEIAAAPAPTSVSEVRIEEGTIAVVRLGKSGIAAIVELRPQTPESDTDMMANDLAILSHMESSE